MATVDELLGLNDIDKTLVVDKDLRTISIPEGVKNIGVESDDSVLKLAFKIPKYYGDVDLSQFQIRINYENALKEGDSYPVKEITINDDDTISFVWEVGRFALKKAGNVTFSVCLRKLDGDKVVKEFNTTTAVLPVLIGLETVEHIVEEYPDLIRYWQELLFGKFNGRVDRTLTISGQAADAAVVGLKLGEMEVEINGHINSSNKAIRDISRTVADTSAATNRKLKSLEVNKANKTDISSPYNFKGNTTYAALPTSSNKVNDTYYCTDKKCKYSWNGSGWYQSSLNESEYTDELNVLAQSINNFAGDIIFPEDTLFFTVGKNLFNLNDPGCTFGGYYNQTNTLVAASNYNQTGFIRVNGGENYTSTYKGAFVLWFDGAKRLISYIDSQTFTNTGYVTAPDNAVYAKFIATLEYWDKLQVEKGTGSTKYAAYEPYINPDFLRIEERIITPEDTTFFESTKNMFNPNDEDCTFGGYFNTSNVLVTDANYNQSGYIPVKGGKNYTSTYKGAFVLWFDSSKRFISFTDSQGFMNNGYATAPVNATYAKFTSTVEYWATLQVEEGTESTAYQPYGSFVLKHEYLSDFFDISDKLFTSYGDSIVAQNMWQPYLVDYYGFIHTNLGIGSTTMAYKSDIEAATPCMVNADRIQGIKDSDPDIIGIMAGTNDAHYKINIGTEEELSKALESKDKTTFIGAYSYLIETLLTWKPKLKIFVMTPMHSVYEIQNGFDYKPYAEAVRTVAEYYAIPVADTAKHSGISKFDYRTYTKDGLHPNDAGGKNLANIAVSVIDNMFKI